ncbi:hypothetical protein MNBD_NITROSPINAE02-972 [hydrothermal vent metagenome]|uniref:DUF4340 domain-containing protein n=1 Tax=hydrothermal vent metagenome TaxID=652676 RepID=A0A3B1BPS7_9ZZZZ
MKLSRIALTLLLAFGLGAIYYYFDIIKAGERDEAERISSKAIGIEAANVTSLKIDRAGKSLALEKRGDGWKIVEPIAVDADNEAVELLLTTAEYMTIAGEVGDTGSYSKADYGVDGSTTFTFGLENGENKKLVVGDLNPVGTDYYAIGNDTGKIILVNRGRVAAILKNLFELRDKDIFPARAEEVTQLVMRLANHVISAKKDKNGDWRLIEPIDAKADNKAIERIVSNLAALTFSGFLNEEDVDLSKYGFDRPSAGFSMLYGGGKKQTTLLIGASTGGGGFYAKFSDKPVVARIPAGIMKSFPDRIDSLRDRHLVHFAMDTIEKVEIENKGEVLSVEISEAEGDDENQDKKWRIVKPAPGKTDASRVFGLLMDIERAKAARFVDESRRSPASLGLDKPEVTITVTTKIGVSVIKISGVAKGEEKRYFAQVDDNATIYEIDQETYRNLAKRYDDLRYKKMFHLDSANVGRILIERLGQIFEVTRSDDNYNLLQPEKRKIDDNLYNRFVWTILGLKYENKAKMDDKPVAGFDSPTLVISVYNAKNEFVDKVTIGGRVDGGDRFYMKSDKAEIIYLVGERFVTEGVVNALEKLIGK